MKWDQNGLGFFFPFVFFGFYFYFIFCPWINYYRYADMKKLMETTDEWLRHRIRAVYWKQ